MAGFRAVGIWLVAAALIAGCKAAPSEVPPPAWLTSPQIEKAAPAEAQADEAPLVLMVGLDGLNPASEGDRLRLRREKVGFVFQMHNLIPNLTLAENCLIVGVGTGGSAAEYRERFHELSKLLGLEGRRNQRLQELSGGRLILGVGVGWMAKEFRALGVDPRKRGAATDATLAFLHHCFASFGSIVAIMVSPTLSVVNSRLSLICCSVRPISVRRLWRMNAAEWQLRQ